MRIAIGISGGVDSAVAAALLRREGHDVFGLFMKNWEEDDDEAYCAAAEDLEYAGAICRRLDVPLHTVNFSAEYWERVFEIFLREYRAGRTPNPDVLCNREIKFRRFIEHARSFGADQVATGHYAGVEEVGGEWRLLKGRDVDKDQSYFLHLLDSKTLARVTFPLSGMLKSEVRALARDARLKSYDRKDSAGICFIGKRRFRDFLARYLDERPGEIVDENGAVLGEHRGVWFYTVGQRAGLGIGGVRGKAEDTWYVAGKDLENNRLVAVQGHNHPALFASSLTAGPVHWISGSPATDQPLAARIRHRQPDQSCCLATLDDGRVEVRFDQPQRGVAPGQSVVFYRGRQCLGGGVIIVAQGKCA